MNRGLYAMTLAILLHSCGYVFASGSPPPPAAAAADVERFAQFEGELEILRQQLRIPAYLPRLSGTSSSSVPGGFGYAARHRSHWRLR